MFEVFAADTDGENPVCPEAYDRAERLLEAYTTVTEKSRTSGYFESYRLKDQGNSRRRANMIDRNLGGKCHPPASVPHRVAFPSLNEKIALPRVIVGGGNGESVEMPTLDIVLDSIAIEVSVEIAPQRRGV